MVATLSAAAASLMITLGMGAAPPVADAEDCAAGTVVDVGGAMYVILFEAPAGIVRAEVYLESNGMPGPQRTASLLPGLPESGECWASNPDTRIV